MNYGGLANTGARRSGRTLTGRTHSLGVDRSRGSEGCEDDGEIEARLAGRALELRAWGSNSGAQTAGRGSLAHDLLLWEYAPEPRPAGSGFLVVFGVADAGSVANIQQEQVLLQIVNNILLTVGFSPTRAWCTARRYC